MMDIDQNSDLLSIDYQLNQSGDLLDNRTDLDRLNFLIRFAELINFYDKENQQNGNWSPFLLKDPVLLGIHILKTDLESIERHFSSAEESLKITLSDPNTEVLAKTFNALFRQVSGLFERIEKWSVYMINTTESNSLISYTLNNVKNTYSAVLWALLDLNQYLVNSNVIKGIMPPDWSKYEQYDTIIWKTNKDKQPFWAVLEIKQKNLKNIEQIGECIIVNGHQVLAFMRGIIDLAKNSIEELSSKSSQFPDTLLLRTFVELLQSGQSDLNKLTTKHLNFYYDEILKQKALPGEADQVFISADLASTKKAYTLGSGTQFLGGLDTDKNPILFESLVTAPLNPAQIVNATTLRSQKADDGEQLWLNTVEKTGTVSKTDEGAITGWSTFGSKLDSTAVQVPLGIAFASPMLLMQEGNRFIVVNLQFTSTISLDFIQNAEFYLSIKTGWFKLSSDYFELPITKSESNEWTILIFLEPTDPPIEVFEKCTDGFQPEWPAFKISFNQFSDLKSPPCISQVKIDSGVIGLKTFELSNDNGALSVAKPFQVFGPIANQNSSFYIGSTELLSKPQYYFDMVLDWDVLPSDFLEYYAEYNAYHNGILNPINKTEGFSLTASLKKIFFFWNWFRRTRKTDAVVLPPIFANTKFKVKFELLNGSEWKPFKIKGESKENKVDLFATDQKTNALEPETVYIYSAENNDPICPSGIQHDGKKLTENSIAGFLRMTLTDPKEGFGNEMYPKVVSAVALWNANAIIQAKNTGTPYLIPAPNAPFIPTVKQFTSSYFASESVEMNYMKTEVPVQCYHYSLFKNYLVYDSTLSPTNYSQNIGVNLLGKAELSNGLQLFPGLSYDSVMFLKMTHLITPENLTLYFELAQSPFKGQDDGFTLEYFYLNESGWDQLTLISDSTRGLTCSGILTFNIPDKITTSYVAMPDQFFWCGIGFKGMAESVAKTTFLKTNGIALTRAGDSYKSNKKMQVIKSNSITGPEITIPEIASVIQPFPSFGGRPAEDTAQKNVRVATRIKTKGKMITANDYQSLIYQEFNSIFYTKVYYNQSDRQIDIRLVKKVENSTDPNAFLPLITKCFEEKVSDYLSGKRAFEQFSVKSFDLEYLAVSATVYIKTDYDLEATATRITQALKIFLSPWIKSESKQVLIDRGITYAEVARFINDFYEVDSIQDVKFKVSSYNNDVKKLHKVKKDKVKPENQHTLLVPDAKQLISWKSAV